MPGRSMCALARIVLASLSLLGTVTAQTPPSLTCSHFGGLVNPTPGAGLTQTSADPAGQNKPLATLQSEQVDDDVAPMLGE